jgi:chromosome segregation ATPase
MKISQKDANHDNFMKQLQAINERVQNQPIDSGAAKELMKDTNDQLMLLTEKGHRVEKLKSEYLEKEAELLKLEKLQENLKVTTSLMRSRISKTKSTN